MIMNCVVSYGQTTHYIMTTSNILNIVLNRTELSKLYGRVKKNKIELQVTLLN